MIIPHKNKFVKENYTYSIDKIKKCNSRKEKRDLIKEFIGNLISNAVQISQRRIAKVLGVSRKLINNVVVSFYYSGSLFACENRGRNKYEENHPRIIQDIKSIVDKTENIDSGLQDEIIYVDPTLEYIGEKLVSEYGYDKAPSNGTISRILREKLGYTLRKIKKNKVLKKIPKTDKIFENVNRKLEEVENSKGSIVGISLDDKASKTIGDLSAGGKSWKFKEALDHDITPNAIVKSLGMMNIQTKETSVYCTTSNSTAEYKVDCLREYIKELLKKNSNITKINLFLDNGPENSSRRKLWKYSIIKLSKELNIPIELVYYPPYHSKYNKIEHFWGVLQVSWSKLIIDSFDKLIGAINGTKYNNVNAKGYLRTKVYEKGKEVDEDELQELIEKHIYYEDDYIKKWSLIVIP